MQGCLLASLRAAKDYFERVHRDGIRRRLGPETSAADNAFQLWLKQQFSQYKVSLVRLLGDSASPLVQVRLLQLREQAGSFNGVLAVAS